MYFKNRGASGGLSFYSSGFSAGILVLATSISPYALAADSKTAGEETIEETIVTASYLGVSDVSASGATNVLSGDELASSATSGLGETLDNFLGLSVTDFGGAVSRPTIRGLSGDRVRVLNNGVKARDVSGLGADHGIDVDLFGVEQIEVVRGPASLLYTGGALGGIVNVVDNTIARTDFSDSKTVAGIETQSVNDGQVKFLAHQGNVAGFNLTASFKDAEFENFEVPKGAIIHAEDMHDDDEHEEEHEDEHGEEHEEGPIAFLNHSDYSKETMRFGVSKVGDWGHIGLSYASNEGLYGVPFHSEEAGHDDEHHGEEEHNEEEHEDEHEEEEGHDEHSGHDEHEDERIFAVTESDIFNLRGSFALQGSLLKSIDYHFRDTDYSLTEDHAEEDEAYDGEEAHDEHEEEEEHAHGGPTVFTNEAQEFGAVLDFSNDRLTQKFSIEVVSEDTSIMGAEAFMSPVSSDEFTLGYFASREVGGFVIDLGIRNDWVDRSGSVSSAEEHDDHEEEHDEEEHEEEEHEDEHEAEIQYFKTKESVTSFGLQIARQLNDQIKTSLNLSSVAKAPASVELFMNGAHLATARYEVGNPNLESERANNVELTFDYTSNNVFSSLTVYRNEINDYIYLQDETEEEHEEHEDEHGGLTLANYLQQDAEFTGFEFKIGTVLVIGDGNLTLSYGRDSVSAEFSSGGYVPRINPDRNLYKASYDRGSFGLDVVFKDVDAQTDIATGEDSTAGYEMLNVKASNTFALPGDLSLNVSVFAKNLLNEVARNHSSFVKNEVPLPGRNYGLKFSAVF